MRLERGAAGSSAYTLSSLTLEFCVTSGNSSHCERSGGAVPSSLICASAASRQATPAPDVIGVRLQR